MITDGTGFYTCKECHKTESLWNHTTIVQQEGEQLEDRRSVGVISCNSGDGTDQRVQSLMFMMMMMMITTTTTTTTEGFLIKLSQVSFSFLPPESNVFRNIIMVIHNFWAVDQKGYTCCRSWMKTDGRGLSMDENWPASSNMVINPYMSVGQIPLHDIISVASKTFKNAHFLKCLIVY
jgi:hypothetical protein